MRHASGVLTVIVVASIVVVCLPSNAAKKSEYAISSYAKYVQIPGATPMGADTCTTCHADIAKDFRHAYHAQQGVECEQCHGPGSLHVQGGGDISKIISFRKRSANDANGVCLSCHARDAAIRNWTTGRHASNRLRCTDCHQTHNYGEKKTAEGAAFVNIMTPGRTDAVENLVPEAKVKIQPRWQANDACLRCHQTERAQMSLPYHHPLREGKMSCADCHDPHGGPAGNNLRVANTNQLCLSCHSQYRGPFAYQHPPVTENCMTCHTAHGSPNTNLLSVSEPALCLQCHAGHHNGAGLPISDRCTNCHGSIHGTDTPTPTGGSRFLDKGPTEVQLRAGITQSLSSSRPGTVAASHSVALVPSHASNLAIAAAGGGLGMLSRSMAPLSGGTMSAADPNAGETGVSNFDAAYSIVPGQYRFVDVTGFGGRVGEYDSLKQSAGADVATAYVNEQNHVTIVTRGNVVNGEDYQAASQLTAGEWARLSVDMRSFVQQQDHYNFYAFPVLDVPPGGGALGNCQPPTAADCFTDLVPSHVPFYAVRRLGKAQAQVKLPKLPVHLFMNGDWQARSGTTQFAYLDENSYVPPLGASGQFCGAQCHYQSQFQPVNYTTRNIGGGADIDIGSVRLTYQHKFSSFNDRLVFPTGAFTGAFNVDASSCEAFPFGFAGTQCPSSANLPPAGPAPGAIPAGSYGTDIPSPNQLHTDSLSLSWAASPKLNFNGNVSYTRLRNTYTNYPQNTFDTDETLNWHPMDRLRVAADYHQHNLLNDFTPYYSLYGNVSYHNHWAGLKLEYELPLNFEVEGYYKRSGITRSNAALWNDTRYNLFGSQIYSVDNTDLMKVVPTSFSNTTGLALRYHDASLWSARAGYEWTGTHDPGYLIVPKSDNRIFSNVTLTPRPWLTFANDTNIIVQNAFPAVPLPNTPGVAPLSAPGATGSFGLNIAGLPPTFQRRNRFYINTASATLRPLPSWNLGLGYSYQQNSLKTYMAFQNDNATGYILDEPLVPYKQITQAYWGETGYTLRQRAGLNFRITYNSARSGFRPDLNPNDAAGLGNAYLISQGTFDPNGLFPFALGNLNTISTQISQVIVPQWIGQSKAYYIFPRKFEGGLLFYYGSYRDYWNPNLNGDLRTFSVYVGRSW
ncbi:MAG TPA: DmsE family decaheme c-type cytochrome [Candidatus Dormibacteraeota bacterium]|nr:DmsE family decaheme c-type cytochrome [Candidatus Dormibacteraeota bacterium]